MPHFPTPHDIMRLEMRERPDAQATAATLGCRGWRSPGPMGDLRIAITVGRTATATRTAAATATATHAQQHSYGASVPAMSES